MHGIVRAALEVCLTLAGVLGLLGGGYLLVLAIAAFFYRPASPAPSQRRLAVLVPAHNESDLLGRCLDSLRHQSYPADRYQVVVVADNCTDDTAAIAAAHGASVLVRDEPDVRGKGHALRWGMDRVLASGDGHDAVVVVDADSVADRDLLTRLAGHLERGREVVQAEYLALGEITGPKAHLRAAALILFHRVRFSGRAALGLPCHLVGNGMLFSRRVLQQSPWNAYSNTEDLEYSMDLRLDGTRVWYAGGALVRGPIASVGRSARQQRLRWEGGRAHVVGTRLPRLLNRMLRGRLELLDAVLDLAIPPLGALATSVAGLTLFSAIGWATGATSLLSFAVPAAATGSVVLYVLVGFLAGGVPVPAFRALLAAPVLLAVDLATRLRLLGGLKVTTWERSVRPSDAGLEQARVRVAQIPVDRVSMDEAVERAMDAVRRRSFMQVCTVNLDFLASARRHPDVMQLLRHSDMNIADGSPIVWLSRVLGRPVPGRVAGADLVLRLADAATRNSVRIFLLGGENGAAAIAADRLCATYPGLEIAGVYEPPHAPLSAFDNDGILRRLVDSEADILLVALGHPKQDRWIDAHRDRLPVSVAVGVGCTFDLIGGSQRRAPSIMQQHGLEWLFRLLHEPRRLFRRYAIDGWLLLTIFLPAALAQRLAEPKVEG